VIYTVEILKSAQKSLARIEDKAMCRLIEAIRALSENPRHRDAVNYPDERHGGSDWVTTA
jgi:mRNA-degrading endonuclease RelE of RelBE toxin-antitoxin system